MYFRKTKPAEAGFETTGAWFYSKTHFIRKTYLLPAILAKVLYE